MKFRTLKYYIFKRFNTNKVYNNKLNIFKTVDNIIKANHSLNG